MIARWSFAVLMLILSGWLYLLTALVMRLIDRAEQLIDREHRALPQDETPEAEGGDWYAKLRAGAEWVDARMQPTFLEPEQPVEDARERLRPTPSPRDGYVRVGQYDVPVEPLRFPEPEQPATTPLERAWEESAAELTEQQQWEAERDAKWAEIKADIERMAKGVAG